MEKRKVEALEAQLKEAKAELVAKRRKETVETLLDEALSAWADQLALLPHPDRQGNFILKFYPPRGSEYKGFLQGYLSFAMEDPWTAQQYFDQSVTDPFRPRIYCADTIEELRPAQEHLLRLFGVLFFIYPQNVDFRLTKDNYGYFDYPDMGQIPTDVIVHHKGCLKSTVNVHRPDHLERAYNAVMAYEAQMFNDAKRKKLQELVDAAKVEMASFEIQCLEVKVNVFHLKP